MAVITLMANYTVLLLLNTKILYSLPSQKKTFDTKVTDPAQFSIYSPSDYVIVAEENPFHPERKIPPEKKEEPPPLPKPDPILYVTVINDSISIAYVEDLKAPRSSPDKGLLP